MNYTDTIATLQEATISGNIAIGGNATISSNATIGHDLKVEGWLDAPNIRGFKKGVFTNYSHLHSIYPSPQDGWVAYVGTRSPFAVYAVYHGQWKIIGYVEDPVGFNGIYPNPTQPPYTITTPEDGAPTEGTLLIGDNYDTVQIGGNPNSGSDTPFIEISDNDGIHLGITESNQDSNQTISADNGYGYSAGIDIGQGRVAIIGDTIQIGDSNFADLISSLATDGTAPTGTIGATVYALQQSQPTSQATFPCIFPIILR